MEKYSPKIKTPHRPVQQLSKSSQPMQIKHWRNSSSFDLNPNKTLNLCQISQITPQSLARNSQFNKPTEASKNPQNTFQHLHKKHKKNYSGYLIKSNQTKFTRLDRLTYILSPKIAQTPHESKKKFNLASSSKEIKRILAGSSLGSKKMQKILKYCRKSKSVQQNPTQSRSKITKPEEKQFFSEFTAAIEEVDLAVLGFVNYSQFCKLLSLLNFISNSVNKSKEETALVLKAWKFLGGFVDSKVKINDLYFFLLSILDTKSNFLPKPAGQQKSVISNLPQNNALRLHKEFYLFYLNRCKTSKASKTESLMNLSSESIQELPEVQTEKKRLCDIKTEETTKEKPQFDFSVLLTPKIIQRVSLKELAGVYNAFEPVSRCSEFNQDESLKSISFNTCEFGDFSLNTAMELSKSEGKGCISRIHVRRVSAQTGKEVRRRRASRTLSSGIIGIREDGEGLNESLVAGDKVKNKFGLQQEEYPENRSKEVRDIAERFQKSYLISS